MKFRPLHDRVLIKVLDSEEKTSGGIIIPDSAQEKPMQGEIIAVGNGAMRCNVNGHDQVAIGAFALSKGGSGSNVAVGANSGEQLSSLRLL